MHRGKWKQLLLAAESVCSFKDLQKQTIFMFALPFALSESRETPHIAFSFYLVRASRRTLSRP